MKRSAKVSRGVKKYWARMTAAERAAEVNRRMEVSGRKVKENGDGSHRFRFLVERTVNGGLRISVPIRTSKEVASHETLYITLTKAEMIEVGTTTSVPLK